MDHYTITHAEHTPDDLPEHAPDDVYEWLAASQNNALPWRVDWTGTEFTVLVADNLDSHRGARTRYTDDRLTAVDLAYVVTRAGVDDLDWHPVGAVDNPGATQIARAWVGLPIL